MDHFVCGLTASLKQICSMITHSRLASATGLCCCCCVSCYISDSHFFPGQSIVLSSNIITSRGAVSNLTVTHIERCSLCYVPSRSLQNHVTATAWERIRLTKYIRFSPFPVLLAMIRLSCIALLCFFHSSVFPSVCEWRCRPNASRSLSLSPLFLPRSALLCSCLPLPSSWQSVTGSFCDCSVCPLGLKQTLPLLREGKLI